MTKTPSRPKRWAAATERARAALDEANAAIAELNEARSDLEDLRSEYEDWQGNLPENLSESALGQKLDAVVEMDFSTEVDEVQADWLDEAEGAELPLGFGKD